VDNASDSSISDYDYSDSDPPDESNFDTYATATDYGVDSAAEEYIKKISENGSAVRDIIGNGLDVLRRPPHFKRLRHRRDLIDA